MAKFRTMNSMGVSIMKNMEHNVYRGDVVKRRITMYTLEKSQETQLDTASQ
jgi:hypothetical protein